VLSDLAVPDLAVGTVCRPVLSVGWGFPVPSVGAVRWPELFWSVGGAVRGPVLSGSVGGDCPPTGAVRPLWWSRVIAAVTASVVLVVASGEGVQVG